MFVPMTDKEFDTVFSETVEEMRSYPGVTDDEAYVMAMSLSVPRGWDTFLEDKGVSKARSRELLASGADKYIAGGGTRHWQG